ncbi:PspC domain-containing protein [Nocardioides marmoriginsengisoli]|nr:PspC domain-containing protein [Nocardioides marmoriginsengisoli]
MNETTYGPGTPPGAPGNQAPLPPHQDLDRLRRSVTDRYVAGVAGGIGRHFGVDPTIIRVLLAVLTLFGGAGVLIYAVAWMFVPEDGKDRSAVNVSSEPRKILLLAAVGVAGLLAVGDVFGGGWDAGWPIASVAVVIGVVLIARDRRGGKNDPAAETPAQPWAAATHDPTTSYPATSQSTYPQPADQGPAYAPPAPPAWQPPVAQPPLIPPHPKRTGILWFWPTIALIAIGLGVVGIFDTNAHQVDPGVYPAVAVAITGVMLLVGSFFGRPGGLILVGIVSTMALSMATVLGTFHIDGRNLEAEPKTAAEVQSSYKTHMGRIYVDLTKVADPAALAGREIDLTLNAGEITVIVPKSLNVDIDAELGFAGGIDIPGYDGGGVQDSAERSLTGTPATTTPALDLDIDVRVGQINVEQR